MLLVLYLKSHCQTEGHLDFSPMLSSKSFVVLHFTFRVIIDFELIFVRGVKSASIYLYIYFVCGCPVVSALFVEETVFSPQYCLRSFVKNQQTIFLWVYFWAP